MKNKKIIIGSRGSKLAIIYAEIARSKILEFCPEVNLNYRPDWSLGFHQVIIQ